MPFFCSRERRLVNLIPKRPDVAADGITIRLAKRRRSGKGRQAYTIKSAKLYDPNPIKLKPRSNPLQYVIYVDEDGNVKIDLCSGSHLLVALLKPSVIMAGELTVDNFGYISAINDQSGTYHIPLGERSPEFMRDLFEMQQRALELLVPESQWLIVGRLFQIPPIQRSATLQQHIDAWESGHPAEEKSWMTCTLL